MKQKSQKRSKDSREMKAIGITVDEAARLVGWMQTFADYGRSLTRIQSNPNASVNHVDDSKAFAAFWTINESVAAGVDPRRSLTDPKLAALLRSRLLRWQKARVEWRIYDLKKQCPDAAHPDRAVADAAFLGFVAYEQDKTHAARVSDFIFNKGKHPPAAWRAFAGYLNKPTPARWKHPDLDSWLILVWPLVEEYRWNYHDVWRVAHQRFNNPEGDIWEKPAHFAKHCKFLGLQITNPRPGRPKDEVDPPLAQLALRIGK